MRNLIILALVASVITGCDANFDSYVKNSDRKQCLKNRYLSKRGLVKCLQSKGYEFKKDPLFSGKMVLLKNED